MFKKSKYDPTIEAQTKNMDELMNFLQWFKTSGKVESFYEGNLLIKSIQRFERMALALGPYYAMEFYETISGKEATKEMYHLREQVKSLQTYINTLQNQVSTLTPLPDKFKQMVENHDWYADYSDDGGVWRRAQEHWKEIQDFIKDHPEYPELQSILDAKITEIKNRTTK